MSKLHENAEDFFSERGNSTMVLSRAAAEEVCHRAIVRDQVVVRIEGGIWNGVTFQARRDAIWDADIDRACKDPVGRADIAVKFLADMPLEYNAFVLMTFRISSGKPA